MKWLLIALVVLIASLLLNLPLLAYAVVIGAAIFWLTRELARRWSGQLSGSRDCDTQTARIGDSVSVRVRLRNDGSLAIPWLLIEDLLPAHHIQDIRPRLTVDGAAHFMIATHVSAVAAAIAEHIACA